MKLLTVPEAARVSGVPVQSLRNWIVAGLIEPVQYGRAASAKGHKLSLVQVLALTAGMRYRREGAGPERVAGIIHFLSRISLERLEAHLDKGETYTVPASLIQQAATAECLSERFWLPGMLIAPPLDDPALTPGALALLKRLDLKLVYEEVQRLVDKLYSSKSPKKRGRRPRTAGAGFSTGRRIKTPSGSSSTTTPAGAPAENPV
jgi:hypothetical protein